MSKYSLIVLLLVTSVSLANAEGIDRKAVVSRHNPVTYVSSAKSPVQVGNGRFAFGADITGLQTFRSFLNNPECPEISDWLRWNPHRINLGRIGFVLTKADGERAEEKDLSDTRQETDLWTGIVNSHFALEGVPVSVRTACHPTMDLISIHVESPLVQSGRICLFVDLPYSDGKSMLTSVGDFTCPEKHKSSFVIYNRIAKKPPAVSDGQLFYAA